MTFFMILANSFRPKAVTSQLSYDASLFRREESFLCAKIRPSRERERKTFEFKLNFFELFVEAERFWLRKRYVNGKTLRDFKRGPIQRLNFTVYCEFDVEKVFH